MCSGYMEFKMKTDREELDGASKPRPDSGD